MKNLLRVVAASEPEAAPAAVAPTPQPEATYARHAVDVSVRGLRKLFGETTIYDGFDLDVASGSVMSIFGPNGCGKSTLINMMAGLIATDGGTILFGGKPARQARLAYVFQNYREALFPWLRAFDNIAYPLKLMGVPAPERKRRVEAIVAAFGLPIDLKRYPYQLSGGQQQSVSILRALVTEPDVLFMDEPFSALDFETTMLMRTRLQEAQMRLGMTTLIVSHDLEEAVYLADTVLLLTRHPTRVAALIPYEAQRPRPAEIVTEPVFVETKRRCLEIFRREAKL